MAARNRKSEPEGSIWDDPAARRGWIHELNREANRGDAKSAKRLRRRLAEFPEHLDDVVNLTQRNEELWLKALAGDDHLVLERGRRDVAAFRAELAGPTPTRLQEAIVACAVGCWLAVQHAEMEIVGWRQVPANSLATQRRHERALKAFERALKLVRLVSGPHGKAVEAIVRDAFTPRHAKSTDEV